jgi:hypothetical protein
MQSCSLRRLGANTCRVLSALHDRPLPPATSKSSQPDRRERNCTLEWVQRHTHRRDGTSGHRPRARRSASPLTWTRTSSIIPEPVMAHASAQLDLSIAPSVGVAARALELVELGLIIDVVLLLGIRDCEDRLA